MITLHDDLAQKLAAQPRHWLVTGAAGFRWLAPAGNLLRHGQKVTPRQLRHRAPAQP